MKNSWVIALIVTSAFNLVANDSTAIPPVPVRSIAEFEPMEGLLIVYPLGIPHSLVREIASDATVFCITNNAPRVNAEFGDSGIDMQKVTIIPATPDSASYYTRDFGPLWVTEGTGTISTVDFNYNIDARWNSDFIPSIVGDELQVPVYKMPLFFAGGNYMTDGYGTAASTELVWNDNFDRPVDTITTMIRKYLGIQSYHVIKHPYSISWEPVEHIDCFAKFLAPDKVAVVRLPEAHQNHAAVEQVAAYFSSCTSAYNRPYRMVRIFSSGQGNEAYLNSTILNEKVLVPVAGTVNDSTTLAAYREAMPGYRIIPFSYDSTRGSAWWSGDALHCRTKGIPDRGMLRIRHVPPGDTIADAGGGFPLKALVRAYSGKPLIHDSLFLYYRNERQDRFSRVGLNLIESDTFSATIPGLSDTSSISYFFHAEDESGRKENVPYIGAADPFRFVGVPAIGQVRSGRATSEYLRIRITAMTGGRGAIISFCPKTNHGNIHISIMTSNGRLVKTLEMSGYQEKVTWDGRNMQGGQVRSGLYLLSLEKGNMRITRPIAVISPGK
ncbi:MAG: agmatine deiminase family protein [Chitinispirillaceae bacterium]|nr:agmatine deiminase family protein [Chitinispirillaceae bacterium]